jgi:hypothetical protein
MNLKGCAGGGERLRADLSITQPFVYKDWNNEKHQPQQPISGPIFELWNCRLRNPRSISDHFTALLALMLFAR